MFSYSLTKENIDGMPLREYIVKSLVSKSYRELLIDREFTSKTGITVLGTLTYHARKHKITLEEVYEYGKKNLQILPGIDYKQWLLETGRSSILQRIKKEEVKKSSKNQDKIALLKKLGEPYHLDFDQTNDEKLIIACLRDFYSDRFIANYLEENGHGQEC